MQNLLSVYFEFANVLNKKCEWHTQASDEESREMSRRSSLIHDLSNKKDGDSVKLYIGGYFLLLNPT